MKGQLSLWYWFCDSNDAKMVVKQSERRWVDALFRLTSPLTT